MAIKNRQLEEISPSYVGRTWDTFNPMNDKERNEQLFEDMKSMFMILETVRLVLERYAVAVFSAHTVLEGGEDVPTLNREKAREAFNMCYPFLKSNGGLDELVGSAMQGALEHAQAAAKAGDAKAVAVLAEFEKGMRDLLDADALRDHDKEQEAFFKAANPKPL